ncbi:hypothetical protein HYV73_04210 [Candidatus Uhrbacteria bacterium]|nr:hypothetical protein [Candidatus Uhrbacteria bacterium]
MSEEAFLEQMGARAELADDGRLTLRWPDAVVTVFRQGGGVQISHEPSGPTGALVISINHVNKGRLMRPMSSPEILTPTMRAELAAAGFNLEEPLWRFVEHTRENIAARFTPHDAERVVSMLENQLRSHGVTLGMQWPDWFMGKAMPVVVPVAVVITPAREATPSFAPSVHADAP